MDKFDTSNPATRRANQRSERRANDIETLFDHSAGRVRVDFIVQGGVDVVA